MTELGLPQATRYPHLIIPAAIKGLSGDETTIQVQSCLFIQQYCEQLKPKTLVPYLPSLIDQSCQLAQERTFSVQEAAIEAIAEVALAAEGEFQPYIERVMDLLEPLLLDDQSGQLDLIPPILYLVQEKSLEVNICEVLEASLHIQRNIKRLPLQTCKELFGSD